MRYVEVLGYIQPTRDVPSTESDIFSMGGGLKNAVACGFFGVLLELLWLLVGIYVAAVAASAVRYCLGMAAIWSDIANVYTTFYLT